MREFTRSRLYVEVYNKIKELILSGVYVEGGRLPSEHELAATFNVSRVTLRQALALLQEDGVIESRQGAGSFVTGKRGSGAEYVSEPRDLAQVFLKNGYQHTEIDCEYVLGDRFTDEVFARKMPAYMGVFRKFSRSERVTALCFSSLPFDMDETSRIKTMTPDELVVFTASGIYSLARFSQIEVKMVGNTDMLMNANLTSANENFFLVAEKLINAAGDVLIHNKFYFPPEQVALNFMFQKSKG